MDFLKGNVSKLYFTLLASALGSTLVTNIYSTVDCVAIGHYAGPVGSAAVACLNPIWPLMLFAGLISGMGGSVMMNNRRGANDSRSANDFFTLSMIFSLISACIVAFVLNVFMRPLLIFFGAEGEVLEFALEYARPIAIVSPTFTLCMTASCFVRNDGEAFLPTLATVVGGVVNIFGDIFFVFDFGLGLGAFGAGLATALGQVVSFLMITSYFFSKKCKLKFTKPHTSAKKYAQLTAVGIPAGITEISFFIVSVVFNKIIMQNLGEDHLAVYGVASTFQVLIYCFFYATGSAAQPVVSANYGANNRARVKKTLKIAIISSLIMGLVFGCFAMFFPELILNLYMDTTPETLAIGPSIIRIYSSSLFIVGISIVASYYLQSILKRGASSLISSLRGIILPILFAVILPLAFGYDAVWFAVPLAEGVCALSSAVFLFISERNNAID